MSYHDFLTYLSQLESKGINLDLGAISRLLNRLNNPQTHYKSILVGGTNGKGSVASMISSILSGAGLKVGLYTSPHLIDFRERIRVGDSMISKENLARLSDCVRMKIREEVTYFEFATALAFLHFSQCGVDVAVLEVGMGGRLDATNVVSPEVAVITNVSREHEKFLGINLKTIAREKGGIIKEGSVCLTAAKQPSVVHVIEDLCRERNVLLYRVGREIRTRRTQKDRFFYYGIARRYRNLRTSLVGRHQIDNAALALGAVELLIARGVSVGDEAIENGLEAVRWEGRLEVIGHSPQLVVDGAHNAAAVSALCRSLRDEFSYERLILVFGVLGDKDVGTMMRKLVPLADAIILTRPADERAVRPHQLRPIAERYGRPIFVIEDVCDALAKAYSLAGKNDLICCTGSLYLVGEVKRVIHDLPL